MRITATFKLARETKGALRYHEVNAAGDEKTSDAEGALIGTLYLRKAALDGDKPAGFTITLDDADADDLPVRRVA